MRLQLSDQEYSLHRGAFLQALSDESFSYERDGIAVVSEAGGIRDFGPARAVSIKYGLDLGSIPRAAGLFIPPFYDMHFHWVQDEVREMPKASLIDWLQEYTFPAESKFADPEYARKKADLFWRRILRSGTVGGLAYSSIHRTALDEAMRCASGEFKIGNVLMTMNSPDFLVQSEGDAIRIVSECAEIYGSRYVCSPRFAPTTAPNVMKAAARAAEENGCFQQTHLDETEAEIDWALGIYREIPGFEDVSSYTEIYARCGMLGANSVFGHCIHLKREEWEMLAESDSVIASCPTSNAPIRELGLGSGLFDWQLADEYGVRWALASDIGGGPFLSMLDVINSFIAQNKAAGTRVSYLQALYRSTKAGAEILGLGDCKGQLAEGFDFDCVRLRVSESLLDSFDPERILAGVLGSVSERVDYDTLIEDTIVRGESVFD